MNVKAQIHANTQFLYHEELQLLHENNLSESKPTRFGSEISNGTNVEFDLRAGTIYQSDAPSDLKVVSWAPRSSLGKTKSYAYSPENGKEAIIYIIENGIDGRNRVIT